MTRLCLVCGSRDLSTRDFRAIFCSLQCSSKANRRNGAGAAHVAVGKAVKAGVLKPARECVCVDCGKQACDYDHRDYNKPLDVQPVCRSCNKRRGPAIPLGGVGLYTYKQAKFVKPNWLPKPTDQKAEARSPAPVQEGA